jgi:hypothetical protein
MVPAREYTTAPIDLQLESDAGFAAHLLSPLFLERKLRPDGRADYDVSAFGFGVLAQVSDQIAERSLGRPGLPDVLMHGDEGPLVDENVVRAGSRFPRNLRDCLPVHAAEERTRLPDMVRVRFQLFRLRNPPVL